ILLKAVIRTFRSIHKFNLVKLCLLSNICFYIMDCTNTDVFSPIRNFDEQKIKRHSDGFSEFLKGPDIFKKKSMNSEALEDVNENIPVNNISNIKSSKTHLKKTTKYETYKSKESSSTSIHDSAFTVSSEKSSSLKKDRPKNISLASKKNDKLRTNQQSEAEHNKKKIDSHSAKKSSANLVNSSLPSKAAAVPTASGSKDIKKDPSSVSRHNPLSQDEMEQRRAENTTMFKIIEQLLEENRLLRTALLAYH
ncbi:unnamed protein product, partial [Larinioides sclopetarius]